MSGFWAWQEEWMKDVPQLHPSPHDALISLFCPLCLSFCMCPPFFSSAHSNLAINLYLPPHPPFALLSCSNSVSVSFLASLVLSGLQMITQLFSRHWYIAVRESRCRILRSDEAILWESNTTSRNVNQIHLLPSWLWWPVHPTTRVTKMNWSSWLILNSLFVFSPVAFTCLRCTTTVVFLQNFVLRVG